MPLPKPNIDEKRQDYIDRCMGDEVMTKEYPDKSQRAAVCSTQWEKHEQNNDRSGDRAGSQEGLLNAKVEYEDLKGVPILYPGIFGDSKSKSFAIRKEITEKTITDIMANFEKGVVSPYLNIDHDEKFTDKIKDLLKVGRLGTISKLYKKGNTLIGDFKSVPKKIAELIKTGVLGQRSVEIFKEIQRAGKIYKNVLGAVSFFGKGLPAVPGLENSLPSLYADGGNGEAVQITYKEGNMDDKDKVTISKTEYDNLKKSDDALTKFKADKENENFIQLKDENSQLKAKVQEMEPKVKELDELKLKVEKDKKAALEKEAKDFVAKFADRIQPSYQDDYVADYILFAKENKERLERFKKEIQERQVGMFQNTEYPQGEFSGKVNYNDEESLGRAIEVRMKQKNISWEKARREIMSEKEVDYVNSN